MDALKLFQEYMGTGLIVLWFLVSVRHYPSPEFFHSTLT